MKIIYQLHKKSRSFFYIITFITFVVQNSKNNSWKV